MGEHENNLNIDDLAIKEDLWKNLENSDSLLDSVKEEKVFTKAPANCSLNNENEEPNSEGLVLKQRKQSMDDLIDEDEKLTAAMTPAKRKIRRPHLYSEAMNNGMKILFTFST